jgi:hypothetical protein
MKKVFVLACLLVFVCAVAFISCKKEQNFSIVPIITFKELKKYTTDSATCTISFTDGDGDIGLAQYDTTAPYNVGSKYFYNMYMVYYFQDSTGAWKPYDSNPATPAIDTFKHVFRIPYLTQDGQRKSLEGDIRVRMNAPYVPLLKGNPPFKFKITLIDRALHISNEVESLPANYP